MKADRLADAEMYAKGLEWALRYDTAFEPADVALLTRSLEQGRARVAALESGKEPVGRGEGPCGPRLRLRAGWLGAAVRHDRPAQVRPHQAHASRRRAPRQHPAGGQERASVHEPVRPGGRTRR